MSDQPNLEYRELVIEIVRAGRSLGIGGVPLDDVLKSAGALGISRRKVQEALRDGESRGVIRLDLNHRYHYEEPSRDYAGDEREDEEKEGDVAYWRDRARDLEVALMYTRTMLKAVLKESDKALSGD